MNEPREVILVNIPDNKEALYIDGQLALEANWISQNKLLDKLVERGIVRGGKRYSKPEALNDVGQFPRQLSAITIRETRYP
jgi:hypothetical protein